MVTFLAFWYGKKTILTRLDWISLSLSLLAIALWIGTDDPLYATIFATLSDLIGYIPTLAKVYRKPESEPRGYYLLMNLKHGLSLVSLEVYSVTTMLFSASVMVINFLLIGIQLFRKK